MLLFACDEVGKLINAGKQPKIEAPGIEVSADRVLPLDTVRASVRASNPEDGPLDYQWSANGGHFILPADDDSVRWIADLKGGSYRIKVKVSNDNGSDEDSKELQVLNLEAPVVDILEPAPNAYFVLWDTIEVRARAYHENGILWARIRFRNGSRDSVLAETGGQSDPIYRFMFKTNEEMTGKITFIVEAKASTQAASVGKDSVTINIEGIIPGKHER